MKLKIYSFVILFFTIISQSSFAQCTETNAAGCSCPTVGSTNCLLLPDILAGKRTLNSTRGWTEYNQAITNVNKGLLRIDVSTPNVGWGPLEVSPTNDYVCGTDTLRNFFPPPNFLCPNGSYPKRLIKQKLYQKNGNTFDFVFRDAGWMQYHPSHGHIHIEGWGLYTLRLKDPSVADTLKWPIVNSGIKVSFCLIDLTTCNGALGDCVDANGNVLNNASFPNYGLAGGYNCGNLRQGISVGKVDIYDQGLDESFVKIPYEACNGNYYVMVQVDPDNHFLEMNENNNWLAAAIPLQKQRTSNTGPYAYVFSKTGNVVCEGQTMELEASGAGNYIWSNGATTQKNTISQAGKYWVRATTPCGTITSDTLTIVAASASSIPAVIKEDTICIGEKASLYASGNAHWFDAATNGNLIYIGNNFQTGSLATNTTFYVADQPSLQTGLLGPANTNFTSAGYFTALKS
ncbi:MAG: lysyl oxidase family protein, partial [Ferruginibacter sp.]